jgi:hypothetical protein
VGIQFIFTNLLLAVLIVGGSHQLQAQAPVRQMRGQVVGQADKPLPAATLVFIDSTNKELLKTIADSNGHFILSHRLQGLCTVVISYTGYNPYRHGPFDLSMSDLGKIRLTVMGTLDEVTVQAKQQLIEMEGGNIVFNVAKSIHAQGVDALEVLKKAPGIFVDNQQSIFLNGRQGALIMIDGKQTYLSGRELADLLKSMPSSAIKSIEIINTPTAKYDASGSAGIINIKTNKSQVKGFSGMVTTGISFGISARQNQDLSLNYRAGRFNVYASYNHFIGHYNYIYGSTRIQNNKVYESATDDVDKRNRMGARLGIDYNINKKNTIGILLNSNFIFGGGLTRTHTGIGPAGSAFYEQTLRAENDYYFQQTNRYNVNVNYKYEHESGTILNLDVDYGFFGKGNGNLQSNSYTNDKDSVLSESLYRSLNDIDIHLGAGKFDYSSPLWKGTLEAGMKYSDIGSANHARFFHVLPSHDSLDNRRSNRFRFSEQLTSGYLNYKKSVGKFTFQGGVRVEHTVSDGTLYFKAGSNDTIQFIKRKYTDIFPSCGLSLKLGESHHFALSYSRRIDRPAYQDLNPFVYLLDELSFWQGNPFLQPQYSGKTALQYVFRNATIATVSYLHTNNYSARITDTLETSKIVMIPRNLGIQKILSFSLTQSFSPRTWWDISCTGTLNHVQNKIAFDQYRNMELRQLAGRVSVQQRFKLPFSMVAEVAGYFSSRKLSGANEITRGISQVDLGLQKTILKNKGTLRLAFSDIYKGTRSNSVQRFDGFEQKSYGYYEARQVRLNFTYKFADAGVKDPRNRNSALENEQGRIK